MGGKVRLYGRFGDWSSQAQVSWGFRKALAARGLLAGAYAVDEQLDWTQEPPGGASAPAAIFTGPMGQITSMLHNSKHPVRYGMLVPNSDRVPLPVLQTFESCCTHLLTPSLWAAGVLAHLSDLPILTVPHGLSEEYAPHPALLDEARTTFKQGVWRVLHLSSSDRSRKSTWELLQAWRELDAAGALPHEAVLDLVMDQPARGRLQAKLLDEEQIIPPGVRVRPRLGGGRGASPAEMAARYCGYHVVCQPSRGEGFGWAPLEARACGVVAVATACTGHSQHLAGAGPQDGVVVVHHGEPAPIDDVAGAVAPEVSVKAIAEALRTAYDSWPKLSDAAREGAEVVRQAWSWQNQLAPFLDRLEKEVMDS